MRVVVDATIRIGNADQAQELDGSRARLSAGDRIVGLDQLDDLPPDPVEGMEARQRILEDHRDAAPAHGAQLGRRHREEVLPSEDRPARHPRPAGEPHHGLGGDALPRAGFADDAEDLAAIDREREATHCFEDAVRRPERHPEIRTSSSGAAIGPRRDLILARRRRATPR